MYKSYHKHVKHRPLSWKTVLHKREAFKRVFHGFDPVQVVRMSEKEIDKACHNPDIIRNRLKIRAAVNNAKAFLKVQERQGTFDALIWSFTGGQVIHNTWKELKELPTSTPLSDAVSKVLK
jgi:DNA-3-methyladenine glycosylase I